MSSLANLSNTSISSSLFEVDCTPTSATPQVSKVMAILQQPFKKPAAVTQPRRKSVGASLSSTTGATISSTNAYVRHAQLIRVTKSVPRKAHLAASAAAATAARIAKAAAIAATGATTNNNNNRNSVGTTPIKTIVRPSSVVTSSSVPLTSPSISRSLKKTRSRATTPISLTPSSSPTVSTKRSRTRSSSLGPSPRHDATTLPAPSTVTTMVESKSVVPLAINASITPAPSTALTNGIPSPARLSLSNLNNTDNNNTSNDSRANMMARLMEWKMERSRSTSSLTSSTTLSTADMEKNRKILARRRLAVTSPTMRTLVSGPGTPPGLPNDTSLPFIQRSARLCGDHNNTSSTNVTNEVSVNTPANQVNGNDEESIAGLLQSSSSICTTQAATSLARTVTSEAIKTILSPLMETKKEDSPLTTHEAAEDVHHDELEELNAASGKVLQFDDDTISNAATTASSNASPSLLPVVPAVLYRQATVIASDLSQSLLEDMPPLDSNTAVKDATPYITPAVETTPSTMVNAPDVKKDASTVPIISSSLHVPSQQSSMTAPSPISVCLPRARVPTIVVPKQFNPVVTSTTSSVPSVNTVEVVPLTETVTSTIAVVAAATPAAVSVSAAIVSTPTVGTVIASPLPPRHPSTPTAIITPSSAHSTPSTSINNISMSSNNGDNKVARKSSKRVRVRSMDLSAPSTPPTPPSTVITPSTTSRVAVSSLVDKSQTNASPRNWSTIIQFVLSIILLVTVIISVSPWDYDIPARLGDGPIRIPRSYGSLPVLTPIDDVEVHEDIIAEDIIIDTIDQITSINMNTEITINEELIASDNQVEVDTTIVEDKDIIEAVEAVEVGTIVDDVVPQEVALDVTNVESVIDSITETIVDEVVEIEVSAPTSVEVVADINSLSTSGITIVDEVISVVDTEVSLPVNDIVETVPAPTIDTLDINVATWTIFDDSILAIINDSIVETIVAPIDEVVVVPEIRVPSIVEDIEIVTPSQVIIEPLVVISDKVVDVDHTVVQSQPDVVTPSSVSSDDTTTTNTSSIIMVSLGMICIACGIYHVITTTPNDTITSSSRDAVLQRLALQKQGGVPSTPGSPIRRMRTPETPATPPTPGRIFAIPAIPAHKLASLSSSSHQPSASPDPWEYVTTDGIVKRIPFSGSTPFVTGHRPSYDLFSPMASPMPHAATAADISSPYTPMSQWTPAPAIDTPMSIYGRAGGAGITRAPSLSSINENGGTMFTRAYNRDISTPAATKLAATSIGGDAIGVAAATRSTLPFIGGVHVGTDNNNGSSFYSRRVGLVTSSPVRRLNMDTPIISATGSSTATPRRSARSNGK
jgi:hypothetical protein